MPPRHLGDAVLIDPAKQSLSLFELVGGLQPRRFGPVVGAEAPPTAEQQFKLHLAGSLEPVRYLPIALGVRFQTGSQSSGQPVCRCSAPPRGIPLRASRLLLQGLQVVTV